MIINGVHFLGKEMIESYAEFEFMLASGAVLGRLGHVLDISGCRILDADLLSKNDKTYLTYLRELGYITNGVAPERSIKAGSSEDLWAEKSTLYYDLSAFEKLGSKLVEERPNQYFWSASYAADAYPNRMDVFDHKNISRMLMHLVAYMYARIYLGKLPKMPFILEFSNQESKSLYSYLDLYACYKSMSALSNWLVINLDLSYSDLDLELSMLYKRAANAGRYQHWSVHKKYQVLKDMGIRNGSVAILFERKRVNPASPMGKINSASIVVFGNFRDSEVSPTVSITVYSLNKTKEEQRADYYSISEENRAYYTDLLDCKVYSHHEVVELFNYGVLDYFADEGYLIEPLDTTGTVTKLVTINGKTVSVEMSEIDAIYWLLCQYEIDFDAELYKATYNNGEPLMWDKYGVS